MIDTIKLKANLINKPQLLDYFLQLGFVTLNNHFKLVPMEQLTNRGETSPLFRFSQPNLLYDLVTYSDRSVSRTIIKGMRKKLPSSQYDITFEVKPINHSVTFEFSLPKLRHGTNVHQLVNHIFDKEYNASKAIEINYQIDCSYSILMRNLNYFVNLVNQELNLKIECTEDGVIIDDSYKGLEVKDLELLRIDFCFNQYYVSKEDALEFLANMKRTARRKNFDSHSVSSYNTSLGINTPNYYFKIYHKGTEFERNKKDIKGISIDRIEMLQKEADKILRYEIEYRSRAISLDSFKTRDYQDFRKKFKYLNTITKGGTAMVGDLYISEGIIIKIKNSHLKAYRDYFRKLNKVRRAVFYEPDDNKSFCYYDKELHTILLNKFLEMIHEYQFSNTFLDLNNINHHNKLASFAENLNINIKKISTSKLNELNELLKKYTLEEMEELKLKSKRTIQRYRKMLKQIGYFGITHKSSPPIDFSSYYYFRMIN